MREQQPSTLEQVILGSQNPSKQRIMSIEPYPGVFKDACTVKRNFIDQGKIPPPAAEIVETIRKFGNESRTGRDFVPNFATKELLDKYRALRRHTPPPLLQETNVASPDPNTDGRNSRFQLWKSGIASRLPFSIRGRG